MMIHVECIPDEVLLRKLGFSRKQVKHHGGKSKVFNLLTETSNQFGMVDEDPGGPVHYYEPSLTFEKEACRIKHFTDRRLNHHVFVLRPRLEEWILSICNQAGLDISKKPYGLPLKPNDLHKIINIKIEAYERVLESLLRQNNPSLLQLKAWLTP